MKRIRVSIGLTINLGDYESIRPSIEIEGGIREQETLAEAHQRLRQDAEVLVLEEVRQQAKLLGQAHRIAQAEKASAKGEVV
jgi:hypothetical protein